VSTTSFDDSAQIDISEDHRALTTTFDKFVIEMVKGAGACDVTLALSMTLPVTGPAQAARVDFFVQGYAYIEQGASARLTVRGNGQVKAKSFPAGFNRHLHPCAEVSRDPGSHLHGVGPAGGAPEPRQRGLRRPRHAQHRQSGHLSTSQERR
jgi:hypothetical protein